MRNILDAEITRRETNAAKLAEKYPDLQAFADANDYAGFLNACIDRGLELDFITSCSMFEQMQEKKG